MPIYEYQCDECGQVFEKMKKRSDPEPGECPQCGAVDPRRTISQTAFQLKGGGWYVTDYKSPTKSSSSSESKASTTTESSTSPSSESKAAESKKSDGTAAA